MTNRVPSNAYPLDEVAGKVLVPLGFSSLTRLRAHNHRGMTEFSDVTSG